MTKQFITLLICLLIISLRQMANPVEKKTPSKLAPGEHIVSIGGLKLHYYVEGKGPVCLFPSPGWGAAVDYAKHLKPLVDHFTMVLYDTRGSGKSTGPDDYTKYSAHYFTKDMDDLREYLGLDKVWIAGHSGGGYQVLRYGIYVSEHLNGIIAIGACGYFDSVHMNEVKRLMQLRSANLYYTERRARLFLEEDPTTMPIRDQLFESLGYYFHDLDNMKYFPMDLSISDSIYRMTGKAGLFSENLLPDLHKITVPVLLIAGDDDIVCNVVGQSVRMYQQLKKGSLSVLNNCGHIPWVEQPAAFANAVEAWLKDLKKNPR